MSTTPSDLHLSRDCRSNFEERTGCSRFGAQECRSRPVLAGTLSASRSYVRYGREDLRRHEFAANFLAVMESTRRAFFYRASSSVYPLTRAFRTGPTRLGRRDHEQTTFVSCLDQTETFSPFRNSELGGDNPRSSPSTAIESRAAHPTGGLAGFVHGTEASPGFHSGGFGVITKAIGARAAVAGWRRSCRVDAPGPRRRARSQLARFCVAAPSFGDHAARVRPWTGTRLSESGERQSRLAGSRAKMSFLGRGLEALDIRPRGNPPKSAISSRGV